MKAELKEDRIVESMTIVSKHDADDDDYSAALPQEDDDSNNSGYVSLDRGSPSSSKPNAVKFGSSDTPLTSTTESVSDLESFVLGPPLSHEDNDNESTAAKRSQKKKETKRSGDASKKSSKQKGSKVIAADDTSPKSSKSKKKTSLKIDYSDLSLAALKLELETCGVSTEGLIEKVEYVKALEDFKKAERKKEKSERKSGKFDGSQSLSRIDYACGTVGERSSSTKAGQKKYAKHDDVLYVSSNGESQSATILKVHLDDELVPFYDIRLQESGLEKQTDNAHLAPLSVTSNSVPVLERTEKPQRRSSMASVRSSKSVKPRRTYAENDKVVYVSSNGDTENATILKVHLDDRLVPFYDIRLHSSGREKQTDDGHLKPCRERRRPSRASDNPKRHSSMGAMGSMASLRSSAKASTEYSFTPDQLTTTAEAPANISFGSALPNGFVSPHQCKRTTVPRRNKSLSAYEQLNSNVQNSVVTPRSKRSPKGNKSLSTSVQLSSILPSGISPQTNRTNLPRRAQSMSVQSNLSPKSPSPSNLPRLDRLDLTTSPSSFKGSSTRSKATRRRSYDNSGDGYKVVSPGARSPTKSVLSRGKKLVKVSS